MKKKKQAHWALAELAEQTAPAASINLGSKFMAGRLNARAGRQPRPQMRLAAALALGVLALVTLGVVPGARAFAEDIIQQLGIAFVDTDAFGDTETMAAVPDLPASGPIVSASLEEVRAQLPFTLLAPTQLPAGLDHVRRETRDTGSGPQVYLSYARTPTHTFEGGVLLLRASEGPLNAPPLLAASHEQAVTVNEQAGIYVHGGWQANGQGDPATRLGDLLWDDAVDSAYLTWEQNGVTYLLQAEQLGLELDDLLQIAASMIE